MSEQPQTAFLLIARYGQPVVPLQKVATDYLPYLNDKQVKEKARKQQLPFICFRAEPTNQQSTWLCNLIDVAVWLDKARDVAAKDWQAMNG